MGSFFSHGSDQSQSVSGLGHRTEFLPRSSEPLSYFHLSVQPEVLRVAGGPQSFSQLSTMVLWKMQPDFPRLQKAGGGGSDTFSSHRKSQVAVSKMRLVIHQQILSAPPSNWTPNPMLLTNSTAIIPDGANHPCLPQPVTHFNPFSTGSQ